MNDPVQISNVKTPDSQRKILPRQFNGITARDAVAQRNRLVCRTLSSDGVNSLSALKIDDADKSIDDAF